MADINQIRMAQIRAAENAVIAGIPADLLATLNEAQRKHEANGGCPGCGSMVLACHKSGCTENADDLY